MRSDDRSWACTGLGAVAHERAHRRGRKTHHADAVALDQAPQPIGPRMVRHALEHDGGAAVEQRRGERHRPHEPAEVGQPEQPVLLADVHAVGEVVRGLDQEAAVREHGSLRPAGRPGRVDDEARPVGLDRQGRRPVILAGDGLVPPVVAPRRPGDLAAEATMDEHRPDRGALGHGLVGRLLQLHDLAATVEAVGRDQELGLAVGETGRHGARAEPGEARRVDGGDPRHREHGDRGLGRHRQEDPDAIALSDAEPRSAFARRFTSAVSSAYVSVRERPSSPSHTIAGLAPRPASTWRSRQLSVKFSRPPGEPAGPCHALRIIQHPRVRRRPSHAQIAHHRVPVPGKVVERAALELGQRGDSVGAHEAADP